MAFLWRNWFLLGLLLSLLLGSVAAEPLLSLVQAKWVAQLIVASVMFAMALPLEFQQIQRVLRRPAAPLIASLINLGVAPLLAWPLAKMLGPELGPGLIVAAATPSTLASASVWTRRAGGNDAVSMMVTLLTNGVCFIVTPMWVRALTSGQIPPFPVGPIVLQLLIIVLLPIVAAQLLRSSSRISEWSSRRKTVLGVFAQLGVLTMVMLGIAQMTHRLQQADRAEISPQNLLVCAALALLLHLVLFWLAWQSAARLAIQREDQIAMGFSASQKTLMVGLSTALQLGLSAIPLISYHLLQMLVDTLLANRIRPASPDEKTIVDPAPN